MKNTIKTLSITAIAALTFTACSVGGEDDNYTPHPYDAPPISEALKHEYLTAINTARATGQTCGALGFFPPAPPLVWGDPHYRAAYEHSEDMATVGVLTHDGSGTNSDWTAQVQELGRGSTPGERMRNNGVKQDFRGGAENAGAGHANTNEILNGWLASDGHCGAIMEKNFSKMGMAHVGIYWTLILK